MKILYVTLSSKEDYDNNLEAFDEKDHPRDNRGKFVASPTSKTKAKPKPRTAASARTKAKPKTASTAKPKTNARSTTKKTSTGPNPPLSRNNYWDLLKFIDTSKGPINMKDTGLTTKEFLAIDDKYMDKNYGISLLSHKNLDSSFYNKDTLSGFNRHQLKTLLSNHMGNDKEHKELRKAVAKYNKWGKEVINEDY